jgi:hypothetical protein
MNSYAHFYGFLSGKQLGRCANCFDARLVTGGMLYVDLGNVHGDIRLVVGSGYVARGVNSDRAVPFISQTQAAALSHR